MRGVDDRTGFDCAFRGPPMRPTTPEPLPPFRRAPGWCWPSTPLLPCSAHFGPECAGCHSCSSRCVFSTSSRCPKSPQAFGATRLRSILCVWRDWKPPLLAAEMRQSKLWPMAIPKPPQRPPNWPLTCKRLSMPHAPIRPTMPKGPERVADGLTLLHLAWLAPGLFANSLYERCFCVWRGNQSLPHGAPAGRLMVTGALIAAICGVTLYALLAAATSLLVDHLSGGQGVVLGS